MCTNRLYIRNNKLDFDPRCDSLYNYVPCGCCDECLRNRSLQYEVRSIAEFEHIKKIGGCAFFYTLTYNNAHLPHVFGVPVFSKSHIQLYHKRLRKSLGKFCPGVKLTWFLSSEFGHKTLRPHYHVIYYLNRYFSPVDFLNCVRKSWKNGFVYPGSNLGLITDNRPFRYVAKYVQKDIYSFDLLDSKGITKSQLLNYKQNKKIKFKDVDILPFHLQSNNFGISLLNSLTYRNFVEGYFVKTDSLGVSRKVPVPLYIYRKKFYEPFININGNISYILTNDGLDLFKEKLTRIFDYTRLKCIEFAKSVSSYYRFIPELKSNFKNECLCKKFFDNFINSDLNTYLSNRFLYSRCSYIPFTFEDFHKDLDIYCDYIRNYSFNPDSLLVYHYNSSFLSERFWLIDKVFNYMESSVKYDSYKRLAYKYNARQLLLSFRTGKNRSKPIKDFSVFRNYKIKNLCLTMLTKRDVA